MKIICAVVTALLGGALLVAFAAPAAAATITVSAGHSVQAAIDSAAPGDTISIGPGTFDSFVVDKSGLTVIGHATVVKPSDPYAGFGVCVSPDPTCGENPYPAVSNVTVSGISAVVPFGYDFQGDNAYNVTFSHDAATGSQYAGFYIRFSQDVTLEQDSASGTRYYGGVYLNGVTDAIIDGFVGTNNAVGIFLGADWGTIVSNSTVTKGCAGLILNNTYVALIENNVFASNTKRCDPSVTTYPARGVGVMMIVSQQVTVTGNTLQGNGASTTPSALGGGLLIASSVPDAGNVISDNTFGANRPVDIRTDSTDPAVNLFENNACTTSSPPGIC